MSKMAQCGEPKATNSDTCQLINKLKVSSGWNLVDNVGAGRIVYSSRSTKVTWGISEYVAYFEKQLTDGVLAFLKNYEEKLDNLVLDFVTSPVHQNLMDRGFLSAVRFFDTYSLQSEEDSTVFESLPHFYMRIAAFCCTECVKAPFMVETLTRSHYLNDGQPICTKFDCFKYFFELLTAQLVVPSTPIMRCAGTKSCHLASCFILSPELDSETGIMRHILGDLSEVLRLKSGVGVNLTNFPYGWKSLMCLLKLINAQVDFFNEKNKRPVSVAAYMELWHAQILEFLTAKLPENVDRCGSIFQGVCVPSLFFEKYIKGGDEFWYLFDPAVATVLTKTYGSVFENEYESLVRQNKYCAKVPIKTMMFQLINSIIKTGTPYILLKEACNEHHWKDAQFEAINAANLCAEIVQQCDARKTAVCNLANVCLPSCLRYVKNSCGCTESTFFDFGLLRRAVEGCVFMINATLLGCSHPVESINIGQRDRSMGIGVQGLADVFAEMGWAYTDQESEVLDRDIFECMYFHAVRTSSDLVSIGGAEPFPDWPKSKLYRGKFHWEGWADCVPRKVSQEAWQVLRERVAARGTFNSQFLALMPTAGSSQLTGVSESFTPFISNMTSKVTNKEEILKPNLKFLSKIDPKDMEIVRRHAGDVASFPNKLRTKYREFLNVFDYSQSELIRRSRLRAPFIDQSQSFSLFLKEEDAKSAKFLCNLIIEGYEAGLKTLQYYCRIQKKSCLSDLECLNERGGELGVDEGDEGRNAAGGEYKAGEGTGASSRCTRAYKPVDCEHCQ